MFNAKYSNDYSDIIKKRKYYDSNVSDNKKLIETFLSNIKLGVEMDYNKKIPKKTNSFLRIMSWNVRYFTDCDNNLTMDKQCQVINDILPDILCLQEGTLGYNKYYTPESKLANDPRYYLKDYVLMSACNIVPSWYEALYGNMIFIKRTLAESVGIADPNFDILCEPDKKKCFFNQYAKTYDNPHPIIKNIIGDDVNLFSQKETRCFTKISFSNYDIFCTHLEAYDKKIRMQQLKELSKQITRKSLIMGDFNIIDTVIYKNLLETYKDDDQNFYNSVKNEWNYIKKINNLEFDSDELKFIKKSKWIDVFNFLFNKFETLQKKPRTRTRNKNRFEDINIFKPNFTVWTNTVVDYIFIYDPTDDFHIQNAYVHFNPYSDHLPLIIDIEDAGYRLLNESNKITFTKEIVLRDYDLKLFKKLFPMIFNGQSISSYDWYDLKTKKINTEKYSFGDPQTFGNFDMLLGTNGVYFLPFFPFQYISIFQTRMINSNNILRKKINHGLIRAGLAFEWNLNYDNSPKILMFPDNMSYYDPNIKYKLDETYDIVFVRTPVGKITQKNYDSITGLHSMVDLNSVFITIYIESTDNIEPKIIDEKYMQQNIYTMIENKSKNINLSKDTINSAFIIFLNSLWYINQLGK